MQHRYSLSASSVLCKSCVGPSGRCVSTRLGEHMRWLKATTHSRLADNCHACGCYPLLKETTVVSRYARQTGLEIIEAFQISKLKANCVSETLIALCDSAINIRITQLAFNFVMWNGSIISRPVCLACLERTVVSLSKG